MTEEQIKHMVGRFLVWRFGVEQSLNTGEAAAATAMVRYMTEDMPADLIPVQTPSICEGKPA